MALVCYCILMALKYRQLISSLTVSSVRDESIGIHLSFNDRIVLLYDIPCVCSKLF